MSFCVSNIYFHHCTLFTIRYDTRCYFKVRWKANMSQLNLLNHYCLYLQHIQTIAVNPSSRINKHTGTILIISKLHVFHSVFTVVHVSIWSHSFQFYPILPDTSLLLDNYWNTHFSRKCEIAYHISWPIGNPPSFFILCSENKFNQLLLQQKLTQLVWQLHLVGIVVHHNEGLL